MRRTGTRCIFLLLSLLLASAAALPFVRLDRSAFASGLPPPSQAQLPPSASSTAISDSMSSRYWNRETSVSTDLSGGPYRRGARIICLSDPTDANNVALYGEGAALPPGAGVLAVGATVEEMGGMDTLRGLDPNVIFVSHPSARAPLAELLRSLPGIKYVHARSAGIDFITSDGLAGSGDGVILTNAKGCFSSTLAEYSMMACSYFAKDLPRLLRNKGNKDWDRYNVLELRGSTLGVIGYGDIGRATARLAKAYGMRVVALRRHPDRSYADPCCDVVYGPGDIGRLMRESDYVLIAAPLTDATRGLVDAAVLAEAKEGAVLINVGRGPIVDEEALIVALRDGTLKGAALDVTAVEPLPTDSPLWELDNVLLSPHNMDKTATFLREATEMFVNENLPRFVHEKELLNPVDKKAGY